MGELDRSLGNRTRRAAFLTYHAISDTGPAFLHVPPDMFERQLALLRRKGWAPGTTAGLDALNAGDRPAAPLAFLTFDDGYLDNHRDALPLLREYGFRAIVFVIPPMVDTGAPLIWPEVVDDQREHPDVMRSMTWDQVGEMVEAGTEIGAHTMTHPKLSTLHGEELRQQLVDSRRAVIDRLGSCDLFAYPSGISRRRPSARWPTPATGTPSPSPRRARRRTPASRSRASRSTSATTSAASGSSCTRRCGRGCCRRSSPPARGSGQEGARRERDAGLLARRAPAGDARARARVGGRDGQLGHAARRRRRRPAARAGRHARAWPDEPVDHQAAANVVLAWREVRRRRPTAILSTGAALAVPFFVIGRLHGIRTVYVESLARTQSLSLSGKMVYPLATAFFVQWPGATSWRRAKYVGSIL